MRTIILPLVALSVAWTGQLVHGQIVVGCFQGQPDSGTGTDLKTYQDIYMSQGACTNFCKSSNAAYAITSDGSTCHCSNSPPLGSNKVDDSKCDKPCMGYPFEMCGGTSSRGLANVLLIGSSVGVPATNNPGSTSSTNPSPTPQSDTTTTATTTTTDPKSKNSSDIVNGGKGLNASCPGMLPPSPVPVPGPTATGNRDNREKEKSGQNVTSSGPVDEEDQSSGSGGASAGAVAAGIMAVFGFGALFVVAVVFSKRRRARIARAAWTENMLLPSSLIHSSNDDELEGHDYTRATPIYKNNANQHIPTNPANMHFPPPPVLHPRQSGPLHMQQPSYPPPMAGPHYNMRGSFQPFPMPPMQYEHLNLNHKEPLSSEPSPFSRGPQTSRSDRLLMMMSKSYKR